MYSERFSAYVMEFYHHEDKREGNQDVSHCECRYAGGDEESEADSCQADQRHGQGKAEEGHKSWVQPWNGQEQVNRQVLLQAKQNFRNGSKTWLDLFIVKNYT